MGVGSKVFVAGFAGPVLVGVVGIVARVRGSWGVSLDPVAGVGIEGLDRSFRGRGSYGRLLTWRGTLDGLAGEGLEGDPAVDGPVVVPVEGGTGDRGHCCCSLVGRGSAAAAAGFGGLGREGRWSWWGSGGVGRFGTGRGLICWRGSGGRRWGSWRCMFGGGHPRLNRLL